MGHFSQISKSQLVIEELGADEWGSADYNTSQSPPHRRPWKPWTLSTPVLLSSMFFSFGLIVILAILQWQNSKNGALFLVSESDGLSNIQNFLYRYLPTIIIIVYGMAWSWIDLDVKRLEPWFQLSHSNGAKAEHSLLMHYPVDFMPLVPFKAAKRGQWAVLSASTIMLFVVWVVTPLQNGIFNTNIVSLSESVPVQVQSSMVPVEQQSSLISGSIINNAYSVLWLGQKLPSFTSMEYALAPFQTRTLESPSSNETLSAFTTLYSTDLDCKPPVRVESSDESVAFDDGNGCLAQDIITYPDASFPLRFNAHYVGYYDDPNVDVSLQLAGCPIKSAHLFLAIWKKSSNDAPNFADHSNATALFCTPSYFSQSVSATVSLTDNSIISMTPVGPKKPLTEQTFNITRFEYLLANSVVPGSTNLDIADTTDIADATVLHQDSRLTNMSLVVPTDNMIGFAVGATHLEPEAYLDPESLQRSLQSAHRVLFALAAHAVMNTSDGATTLISGNRTSTFGAVSLIPAFALSAEAFLALIVGCGAYLLYITSRRHLAITQDPDSLAQIMSHTQDRQFQTLFQRLDSASESILAQKLKPITFGIERLADGSTAICVLESEETATEDISKPEQARSDSSNEAERRPVTPRATGGLVGISIGICLIGAIAVLVLLHYHMLQNNGLPLPSQNTIVQQIVLNFIPTGFATLMEPFWTLINRLACLMRPMEQLRRGEVPARRSLLLEYTSLPPQLVIVRALRAGHFMLASLSSVALLANVLTVALSGLFSQREVFQSQAQSLAAVYQPQAVPTGNGPAFILSLYNQNDPLYVASANFSNQTTLPLWTSPNYYFLPLIIDSNTRKDLSQEYRAQMIGYGADLECQELSTSSSKAMYALNFSSDATQALFVTSYWREDGSVTNCNINTTIHGDPQERRALEISTAMVPSNNLPNSPDGQFCASLIVKAWIRATIKNSTEQTSLSNNSSTTSSVHKVVEHTETVVSCQARQKSAQFNVTFSPSGSIIETTQLTPDTYQLPKETDLAFVLNAVTDVMGSIAIPVWHNDTVLRDWPNYLIKALTNSTSFVDSSLPPPTFSEASDLLEKVYARLFPIQLSLSQLAPASPNTPRQPATLSTLETRVFMSEPLFRIAIAILALDLVILVLFYSQVPRPFLPRLPISIASQVAYFAGSHVVDDVMKAAGGDLQELDHCGYRYAYGKFVGKDGWTHVGIEREPFVKSLEKLQQFEKASLGKRRWFR